MFLSIMNMDAVDTIDGRSAIESNNLQVQSIGRICAVRVITIDSVGCHFLELSLSYELPLPLSTVPSIPRISNLRKTSEKETPPTLTFVNRRCLLTARSAKLVSNFRIWSRACGE